MILDTVGVANMDEVNLSDMIVSGVIFSKFTSLFQTSYVSYLYLKTVCKSDNPLDAGLVSVHDRVLGDRAPSDGAV